MRVIRTEVKDCYSCPYSIPVIGEKLIGEKPMTWKCSFSNDREIKDDFIEVIPDWCRLEDPDDKAYGLIEVTSAGITEALVIRDKKWKEKIENLEELILTKEEAEMFLTYVQGMIMEASRNKRMVMDLYELGGITEEVMQRFIFLYDTNLEELSPIEVKLQKIKEKR